MAPIKVSMVGSGNWGTTIARIVASNAMKYTDHFEPEIKMWIFDEMIKGRKLSEIINSEHENVKYLPGKKIPTNVIAEPDLIKSCMDADVLIFITPHQFIASTCNKLRGHLRKSVIGVSLIKGVMPEKKGGIRLVTEEIQEILEIPVYVLMGANIASEVADDHFCEATLGYQGDEKTGELLKLLFQNDNFRVRIVPDIKTVELCGALKNIVACAAGISDGLGYGKNTKAAVLRIGLLEITHFVEMFYPGSHIKTFFESCGIADLIATCYGGRNRAVCEAFVKTKRPLAELEQDLLNGQSAQGPLCAEEVCLMLRKFNIEDKFPLFVAVNKIIKKEIEPIELIRCIRQSSVQLNVS